MTEPSGFPEVDLLGFIARPTIDDYVRAASQYIVFTNAITPDPRRRAMSKRAQLRLSLGLAHVLAHDLREIKPSLNLVVGEHTVGGGLRSVKADLHIFHPQDGLRLAVELKPVHLAVGRAIWNRFGDVRTFAVNIHLKFPFAVVGGVLTFPTMEAKPGAGGGLNTVSTTHLIERALRRFGRVGSRVTEGEAPHMMEAIGVVVFNPLTAALSTSLPSAESGLRWEQFVANLADAYEGRFED